MAYLEVITSFVIAVLVIILLCWLFKVRKKPVLMLIINAVVGIGVLIALNAFNILSLPINALNGLVVGFFGIFGIAFIWAVVTFL